MDIHIFEPQGISFLETESTFMTNELAEALTISQNKTKVGLLWSVGKGSKGPVFRLALWAWNSLAWDPWAESLSWRDLGGSCVHAVIWQVGSARPREGYWVLV